MNALILALVAIPWLVAALLLFAPRMLARVLVVGAALVLSGISLFLFFGGPATTTLALPAFTNQVVLGLDVLMLLYFVYVAISNRSWIVGLLSGLQIGGLVVLVQTMGTVGGEHGNQIFVDRLSMFMYLLINVVSGLICVYSLKYIEAEEVSEQRKRNFLAILLWFVGVMNLIVSVDNLEWFFLLFEATTLASFWLIRFRLDETSIKNALRALWMNQIGGVSILVALVVALRTPALQTIQLSELVQKGPAAGVMIPFALVSVAALIKGAQMPFSSWLFGAMVAPTPVSALLHSSTMVKLAPFILLRLSPAIKGTTLSLTIMLLCAFVFVVSAVGALARDNFKLILAHSTIALLSLMCLLAAQGSEIAVLAALFLVLFHGVSKCLLFLEAGVMERVFHAKYTPQMQHFAEMGPVTTFFVGFGFVSLMLPPFGAFVGKWLAVELLASTIQSHVIASILMVMAVAVGGAVLTVLYFKVIGGLISRSGKREEYPSENLSAFYRFVPGALCALLVLGMVFLVPLTSLYLGPTAEAITGQLQNFAVDQVTLVFGSSRLSMLPMIGALLLFPLVYFVGNVVRFRNVDRVKEYTCGEKIELEFSAYYFNFDRFAPLFVAVGVAFFIAIVLVGRMPL
jgi:ech hydrogenase subunit A